MECLFPSKFPHESQVERESGLIPQGIWQHSLVWMTRILNDILFVIIFFILFIYFIYLFYLLFYLFILLIILFIYYLFQSTVVIDSFDDR